MGSVPWKEVALVGLTTIGVCYAIGRITGAENLKKKKKAAPRGPNGASAESMECDALLSMAENGMKKGAYSEVEQAYLRVLDIAATSEDPNFQLLPMYIHRRLADLYERTGKFEKAVNSLSACVDFIYKQKPEPSQEDLQAVCVILEKIVNYTLGAHGQQAPQAEKYLLMWLEAATKINKVEYICFTSTLLGKIKESEDKITEAESYYRRALSAYKHPADREELWLHCKMRHFECLSKLENHEAAKQCVKELADFLLNADFDKRNALETLANTSSEGVTAILGNRCLFLGYYTEAEEILKAALAIMKRKQSSPLEVALVDHDLAVVWSASGRLQQAREKIKEMKEYMRTHLGKAIFPSATKYLNTQSIQHDTDGTTIVLHRGKDNVYLKPGSVLVVRFDNPDDEKETLQEVEHIVQPNDDVINITAPVNYSNYVGQLFSAEVGIYSSVDKSTSLGTHFVFIPSTTPVAPKKLLRPEELAVFQHMMNVPDMKAEMKNNPELLELIRHIQAQQAGGGAGGMAGIDFEGDDDEIEFDEDFNEDEEVEYEDDE